jgi:aminopeptidase
LEPSVAAKNALESVFEAKKGEKIVIFCDDIKKPVGEAFALGAENLGLQTQLFILETDSKIFRKEIPQEIMKFLIDQRPQIYVNLLRGIREETPFRIRLIHLETKDHKTRLGHCPGVTEDMLTRGALALTKTKHGRMHRLAEELMDTLKQASRIEIRNPSGTLVSLSVEGRPFVTDTKINWDIMKWLNLPTGEVYAAPVENSLEGKFVCDMAIGGIGPVAKPVTIIAKDGRVQNVTSPDAQVLKRVENSLDTDQMSRVIGEFAMGINSKARFVEEFLESEKMCGTVHIAFGENSDMPGGKNNSANHMDFLISGPTVKMISKNGTAKEILTNGTFQNLSPSV